MPVSDGRIVVNKVVEIQFFSNGYSEPFLYIIIFEPDGSIPVVSLLAAFAPNAQLYRAVACAYRIPPQTASLGCKAQRRFSFHVTKLQVNPAHLSTDIFFPV